MQYITQSHNSHIRNLSKLVIRREKKKARNKLLAIFVSLAIIFSSISLSGIAFGEEIANEGEFIVEATTIDDGEQLEDDVDETEEQDEPDEAGEEELGESKEGEPTEELGEEDLATEPGKGEEAEKSDEEELPAMPGEGGLEAGISTELLNLLGGNEKLGSLKVHKRIKGLNGKIHANLGNGEFEITLTGPHGPNSEVRTLIINKNGNTGEHVTFEDLPYGTYTIEETQIDDDDVYFGDYYISANGNNGKDVGNQVKIDKKGQEQRWLINKEIENPNIPKVGQIKITKKVITPNHTPLPNDDGEFEFELFKKGGQNWVSLGTHTIIGNDFITIEDLEPGKYKVVEIDSPEGYYMWVEGSDNNKEKEVKKDKTTEFKFTNKRTITPIKGSINVTKYLYDEEEEMITDDNTEFEFVLYKKDNGNWVEIDSMTLKAGVSAYFDNLSAGEYKVSEENIPLGYVLISSNHKEVTISTNGQIALLDFDNEKVDPPEWSGTIRVKKSVEPHSPTHVPSPQGFAFELWKDGAKVAGPLTTDEYGEVDFDGLAAGTYEVREVSNGEYTPYFPNGSIIEIGPNNPNDNDNVYEIRVINKKIVEWNKGKIIITKIKLGLPGRFDIRLPENPNGITFQLEGDNLPEPLQATTSTVGFVPGIAVFDNLPEGTYILKELVPEGYTSDLPEEGLEIVINKNIKYGIRAVVVKNSKVPEVPEWKGKLVIQKQIQEGEAQPTMNLMAIPSLDGFEFELWKDGSRVAGPLGTDSEGKVTFVDLPAGTYNIVETNSKGLIPVGPFAVDLNEEVANDENTVTITFTNHTIPKTDILVRKNVGNDSDLSGFTFELYKVVYDGDLRSEIFIESKTTDVSGVVVFEDQADGEYVIYEVARDGYVMGIGEYGSGEGREFYHSNNMVYPIVIDNRKIEAPTGEIDVTKRVVDENDNVILGDTTVFTFRLYRLVESTWVEVLSESPFNIVGNGTVTIDNLPLGRYRVVETSIPSGYALITSNNLEVELDEEILEVKAEFTNRRIPPQPPTGDIVVTKRVVNQSDGVILGDSTAFMFRLYRNMDGTFVEVLSESPFFITGNGTRIIDNLPLGEYRVVEVSIPSGYALVSANNIEVELDQEILRRDVLFTNRRDDIPPPPPTGEFDVSKRVIDEDDVVIGDDSARFMFRLYRLVEGEFEEVLSESPFFITGNGTVTIDNLPLGEYRVVEVNIPSGYSLDSANNIELELDSQNLELKAEFTNKKDDIPPPPPPTKGEIEVTKIVQRRNGDIFEGNETRFYFELDIRIDDRWVTIDDGFIDGNGNLVFRDLEDGEYRVREVDIDDDFDLITRNNLLIEIEDGSEEEAEFINRRVPRPDDEPDDDPDDEPNDDPDDEPEGEPGDEPDDEPEVIVIIESVPEAPPILEVPEVLEEVEVIEEQVPQAAPVRVLPRTGSANPLAHTGLGGIILALGLFLKKKED